MPEVITWNDAGYVVIVDDGDSIWGQFNVAFLGGTEAPATETERDAYAKGVADDTKARFPDAVVTVFKQAQGAKTDSTFCISGS